METKSQTAMDTAQHMKESASQTMSDMTTKAQEVGSTMGEQAHNAATSIGRSMNSLAGAIREQAPAEGMGGATASTVANQLEVAGSYLEDHSFENMARDLTTLIRRYPVLSLLIGFGIGYWWLRNSEK